MKWPFGYYKGYTLKEIWRYAIKYRIRSIFYSIIYRFYIPKEISTSTPLHYRFKIVSDSGIDYTKKYLIKRYNSETKKATIIKVESIKPMKPVLNNYNETVYEVIELPKSHIVFV